MEIILKKTVDTLGEEGDIVKVKPGYARNYLIPKQLAVIADRTARAALTQEKGAIEARKERERKEAEGLASKLTGTILVIKHRVGEEDRLFGSVTAADIAEKLAEAGIAIDRKKIILSEAIKTLGETVVPIKVGFQMTAEITVQVLPL